MQVKLKSVSLVGMAVQSALLEQQKAALRERKRKIRAQLAGYQELATKINADAATKNG